MILYQHLAAAVAFSPRLDALLAETAERARTMAGRVSLIHAGAQTDEKEARLRESIVAAGLPPDIEIFWVQGAAPDDAILRAVRENDVDLLLAGALEKEKPIRYYLGSVAHNLVREAPCSLIILPDPKSPAAPTRRIVLVTDFSDQTMIALTKTVRWAEEVKAERVYVIRVIPQYGSAMVLSEGVRRDRAKTYQASTRAEEESLLTDLVDAVGPADVHIETRVVEGRTGYEAAQFVRNENADLLVMPSAGGSGHFFERLFPSDMEWVLREIPCTLWVIRDLVS